MSAPGFFRLSLAERTEDTGIPLPVSHGSVNTWITIPWDVEVFDPAVPGRPNGMHDPNGWTVLYGPCLAVVSAFVRVKRQEAGCSMHVMPRVAKRVNGQNIIVRSDEATERGVLAHEAHPQPDGTVIYSNTHLDVTDVLRLEEGERLQIVVDYWNAANDAVIVGGTVSGLWWPLDEGAP